MQWDEIYPTLQDFDMDISAGQLFVGLTNGKIAVIYTLNQLMDEAYSNGKWRMPEKSFAVLHRLCVHPEIQNLGIAQNAMWHIEDQVKRLGMDAIRLDVYSQNPYAIKLYQKCGYTQTGTVDFRKGMFYLMEKYL